jgi:ankyrin repeat protein
LGTLACLPLAAQEVSDRYYQAIRNNALPELRTLITAGSVNAGDKRGTTPLMFAAAYGSLEAMQALIDAGADVNARNAFDATALMWCATDLAKVKLLVSKGADVNARSKQGRTPLLIAASSEGTVEIVKLLLDKGADLKKADANPVITPLGGAANAGDAAVVRLLLDRGAVTQGPGGAFALMNAVANGSLEIIRMLMDKGVDVNSVSPPVTGPPVKNGNIALGLFTPLILAASHGGYDAVKMLVDAKANVNAQDVRGMTPLMLALSTDRPDTRVVKLLIERGADTAIKSKNGETAADWARKYNHPEVLRALKVSPVSFKPAMHASPLQPKQAAEKSIALLQRAASTFFVEGGCASCHSHNLTAMAVDVARSRGLKVDEAAAATHAQQSRAFWMPQDQTLTLRIDAPGSSDMVEYGVFQFAADGAKPATYTDAMVHNTAALQQADGSWQLKGIARAPMEDGAFARTAMGLRSIQLYGPAGRKAEWDARVAKAAAWLQEAKPMDSEDANMQLLGLKWAGVDKRVVDRLAQKLIAAQRPDGGWAQTAYLSSDAYATGQTLYALHQAGIPPANAAYRRGVEFLLKTQLADGSWHVRSRAPKFQPYFQGGFPHDHDQWISASATAWSAMAIGYTLPESKAVAMK